MYYGCAAYDCLTIFARFGAPPADAADNVRLCELPDNLRSTPLTHSLEDLVTPRLALVAITAERIASERAGIPQLAAALDCAVPKSWPPEHWEPQVFDVLLAQYARFPEAAAWHRYVAVQQPDGTRLLIGTLGAFWRPETPAECEVGYSILRKWQGRGFATEAVRTLLGLIRQDARITSVIAHTFPELKGSIRVMQKCGFRIDGAGEEAGTTRYRLRLKT